MCCSNPGSCSDAFKSGFATILLLLLVMGNADVTKYTAERHNCQKTFDIAGREAHYFNALLLTPLAIDHSHPFPFISNKSLSLAVELKNPATGDTLFARLKIPSNLKRWMRRNLDKRVEALVPVDAAPVTSYLMFVLETYLNDNSQRWVLQPDGDYKRCYPKNEEPDRGAHRIFMRHTAAMEDPIPAAFEIPGASN